MTVSATKPLPGPASFQGHAGRQAPDDAREGAAFADILRGAAKPPEKTAHMQKRGPADAVEHQPRWAKFAGRLPGSADEMTEAMAEAVAGLPPALRRIPGDDADDAKAGPDKKKPDEHAEAAPAALSSPVVMPSPIALSTPVALSDPRAAAMGEAEAVPANARTAGPHVPAEPAAPSGRVVPNGSPIPPAIASAADAAALGQKAPMTAPAGKTDTAVRSTTPLALPAATGPDEMPGQATKPVAAVLVTAAKGAAFDADATHRPHGRRPAASDHVAIVSERSFPAPAPQPVSRTVSDLAGAIASDNGWRQALSPAPGLTHSSHSAAVPAHLLKIELHPAELGVVTASLRLSSGQLSIELKPDSHEAHRKLSSDTDTIVKALRGLGFDVDRITVLQPQIAPTAPARSDAAGTSTASAGRDQSSFQPGSSGGNGDGSGSQQSGRNRNDDGQNHGRAALPHRERARGDLFI